jgi:phospholipid-binding lipoprotein MlaA
VATGADRVAQVRIADEHIILRLQKHGNSVIVPACTRSSGRGVAVKKSLKTLLSALLTALAVNAVADDKNAAPNPDPWESVNRKIFVFNDFADRNVLKPIAKGYQWVTPQFLQDGVHNIFDNVGEVGNIANSLLQAKFRYTANDSGRLLVNSTFGLLGFFDVASHWGLEAHDEDFGQTLGYWGVHTGPYLMVPLLGPRTVRDGFGSVADAYSDPIPYAITDVPTRNQVLAGRVIDNRAQLLKAEELISGDRYIFLRDAYLQRREFLVKDGVVEDSFGSDDFSGADTGANGGAEK